MTVHYDLIELCAGTAGVAFRALGTRFPVSRIGSKSGYAAAILAEMKLTVCDTTLLVESDKRLAALLRALCDDEARQVLIDGVGACVRALDNRPAEAVWRDAVRGSSDVDCLVRMCGARGGVGGFKGRHKLRPNVDGFIPSLPSLVRRLETFRLGGTAVILCADVSSLNPWQYAPTRVYVDPPYEGRQGYTEFMSESAVSLAQRWALAGHSVYVSEGRALPGATRVIDLTARRVGQARMTLTTSPEEWLSVYETQEEKDRRPPAARGGARPGDHLQGNPCPRDGAVLSRDTGTVPC